MQIYFFDNEEHAEDSWDGAKGREMHEPHHFTARVANDAQCEEQVKESSKEMRRGYSNKDDGSENSPCPWTKPTAGDSWLLVVVYNTPLEESANYGTSNLMCIHTSTFATLW